MGFFDKLLKTADHVSGLGIIPGPDPTAGCDVKCEARVVGIADLPADGGPDEFDVQVSLLRLMAERPDGEHEGCVRQDIPPEFQAAVVPGARLIVRTHPVERGRMYVMWGNGPNGASIVERGLLRWPDHDRWPHVNAIEIYKKGEKRNERMADWRNERTAFLGQLADARPTSTKMNGRRVFELVVNTERGPVTVRSQMPDLALARLLHSGTDLRVGAPIVLLISASGKDIDVDWEATIAQPENWRGGAA
ncbi:MAG: hypothetical protein WCC60_19520 [Ilumatobacteraceae bacterium]